MMKIVFAALLCTSGLFAASAAQANTTATVVATPIATHTEAGGLLTPVAYHRHYRHRRHHG